MSDTEARETLEKYCVTCHNQKLKTAGLMLDGLDVADIGNHPGTWERIVLKLRGGSMPPNGARRPDPATYEALSSWIEGQLDQAGAVHPNPGRAAVHRLNR